MVSSHRLVIKDAAWQLFGRIISALFGFLTIKIITPYLWPLQYGDYSTILKYFAIRTALADLWLYVLAVKRLWEIKEKTDSTLTAKEDGKSPVYKELRTEYGKFVWARVIIMSVIYILAIVIAYLLPAYTSNPYLVRWLPFGMIFSASFMFAGVQQLPLQIFRRMDQLSRTLITARLSQIAILIPVVFFIFKNVTFNGSTVSLIAFCCIMFSVVASSIGQNLEIHFRARKILPLKINFDRKFTRDLIKRNRQYGVSYYLSSFHTLIVLLFLGRFFPTSGGQDYTWIRALALSLIEILLIIPSALGNSLLHKISHYTLVNKRKSLGNLLVMMTRIGGVIAMNFRIFSDRIIRVVSGKAFIWTFASLASRWSNQILPFLWIVLFRSFIKQVYNYLFVAVEKQNVLLPINLMGVLVGIPLWIRLIPKYGLRWGVLTQLTIEFLFMLGAIRIGKIKKVQPIFSRKTLFVLMSVLCGIAVVWYGVDHYLVHSFLVFFIVAILLNAFLILLSRRPVKKIAKGLTVDEVVVPTSL
jgi:O-antigen/teichoic acid export membrane protein